MKKIDWYGKTLTDKYYILPQGDLDMPIIKTPCVLTSPDEIVLTFCTEEDAKVEVCPECGCDTLISSFSSGDINISHWRCLRGHEWETKRGITLITQPRLL